MSNLTTKQLNLGVRAHDYGQGTPAEIAELIGQFDVSCVQLAPMKSFPCLTEASSQMTAGFAQTVRDAFARQQIQIAVLGCYINPIHPDKDEKELSLRRFERHLEYARDFGCALVGTETGSRNADCSFHPNNSQQDAYDELVESVYRLSKVAELNGVDIGIEPVAHHHIINTREKMLQLLEQVNSPRVKVIYDPVNLFPLEQADKQIELMKQDLQAFAPHLAAVHIKDFVIEQGIKTGDLPLGEGVFAFEYFIQWLSEHKPYIHSIFEATNPNNVEQILTMVK